MEDISGEVTLFYAPISIEEANSDEVKRLPELDKDYANKGVLNKTYYCEGTRSVWCRVRSKRVPQIGWCIYGLPEDYDWGDIATTVMDIDYNIKTDEVVIKLSWPIRNLRDLVSEVYGEVKST